MLRLEPGVSRRGFLESSVTLGALMLPRTMRSVRADDEQQPVRRARSVIVLVQEGGMSHLESWDPKPDAPAEVRGSFQTISTSNPQLTIGEHMPRLARQAHLYNVVRSVYMDNERRDHSPGLHWILTGYDNQAAGVSLIKENTHPSVGSIVAHQSGGLNARWPADFRLHPQPEAVGQSGELYRRVASRRRV